MNAESIPPIVTAVVTGGSWAVGLLVSGSAVVAMLSMLAVTVPWLLWLKKELEPSGGR